jgi:predicted dehydrogenase
MKALVLGCGSIGRRHARNLLALGLEVHVYDPDPARASEVAGLGAASVADRNGLEPDLVVVATPTAQHVDDLLWSLGRGAHVFVEKPLGASRTELEKARGGAAIDGRAVMIGCNMRFTEGFQCLVENLDRAGHLLSIQAAFGHYLPDWRPDQDYRRSYSASRALGGGIILDAIHEIDYVLALAGPVRDVDCRWSSTGTLQVDVEDLAEITITHDSGILSQVHLDYVERVYTRNCRVVGSEATLVWDHAARAVTLLGPARSQTLLANCDADPNEMYVAEMRAFLEAVEGRRPTPNDLSRAAETLDVALRALEAGGR